MKRAVSTSIWKSFSEPFKPAVIAAALAVCAFGQTAAPNPDHSNILVSENYMIGVGDVIDVNVTKTEILSRAGVRVSERGTIQLPMFDEDVPAACMTERALADMIQDRYKKYLVEPSVLVSVREFNANPVFLQGAVHAPGKFQVQRPTRLSEIINLANGPTENAGETVELIRTLNRPYCSEGKLISRPDEDDTFVSMNLSDTMKGVETANPLVRAGDIIRVLPADEVNAYLVGSVKSSMTIKLKGPVTLTEAVAMAGGLAPGANAEKILIRRQIPNSINRADMIVSLKAIYKGEQEDVLLQANDIINVPGPSGTKKLLKRVTDMLLPSLMRIGY